MISFLENTNTGKTNLCLEFGKEERVMGRGHKGTPGVLFLGLGAGDQDVFKWGQSSSRTLVTYTLFCVYVIHQ